MNYPDDNYPGGHGDEDDPKENGCSTCGGRLETLPDAGYELEIICPNCDTL